MRSVLLGLVVAAVAIGVAQARECVVADPNADFAPRNSPAVRSDLVGKSARVIRSGWGVLPMGEGGFKGAAIVAVNGERFALVLTGSQHASPSVMIDSFAVGKAPKFSWAKSTGKIRDGIDANIISGPLRGLLVTEHCDKREIRHAAPD